MTRLILGWDSDVVQDIRLEGGKDGEGIHACLTSREHALFLGDAFVFVKIEYCVE
jgi:hypothetical protein